MAYVDGFIVPVPKDKLEEYRDLAEKARAVWLEYGALEYKEWIADDVSLGEITSFPRSVLLEPGEIVIFAWIVYASRAQRDEINAKVMKDPRLALDPAAAPFAAKRMIFGGFQAFVES
jgi:uncharacterized protein YbaA (DUF1428 family)